MRRVDRTEAEPEALKLKGAEELAKATTYFGPPSTSPQAFPFAIYKHQEVKNALERMFRGKCAYCETFYASGQPMDVEHFRPKGAVDGDDEHPGYWWIAMAWKNLLPSCIDSNRTRNQVTPQGDVSQARLLEDSLRLSSSATVGSGKKDSFPIASSGQRARRPNDALDAEKALLLNPCEDEPGDHLRYYFHPEHPVSFVVPAPIANTDPDLVGAGLSLKGGTSIHVYGLNRVALVQARTEVLRKLEFLGALMIDLKALAQDLGAIPDPGDSIVRAERALTGLADRLIGEMRRMADPGMPYSAMVGAWLEEFTGRVART